MGDNAAPLVRRGRRNANYTAIANALIDHPSLGPEARITLIYLLSKPDDWQLQIGDIRRLLGTGDKPCGRNKAYDVVRELKASGYVVAREEFLKGRFHRVTYFVFDEPVSALAEIDADQSGKVAVPSPPAIPVDRAAQPCAQNRDTVRSPCPENRDPEKGDLTKEGSKQTTETPLHPPSRG